MPTRKVARNSKHREPSKHNLFFWFSILTVSGCTAIPAVNYGVVNSPDTTGKTKFVLQSSIINIAPAQDNSGAAISGQWAVTSLPVADPSARIYTMDSSGSLGVTTTVQLTHIANTQLVNSVGTNVQDNRVKDIGTVASIAAAVIPFAAAAAKPATPSAKSASVAKPSPSSTAVPLTKYIIDVSRLHLVAGNDNGDQLTYNNGYLNGSGGGSTYSITYSKVPSDATPLANLVLSSLNHVLFYSACRNATLTIPAPSADGTPDPNTQVASVVVSDPNFVQTIAFPANGTITMDSACGVSVSSQAATISSPLDIANALVSAATTIQSAEKGKSANTQTTSGTAKASAN